MARPGRHRSRPSFPWAGLVVTLAMWAAVAYLAYVVGFEIVRVMRWP